jgi:hypothetical protein
LVAGSAPTLADPPPTLREAGATLWRSIMAEYAIVRMLPQFHANANRAAGLSYNYSTRLEFLAGGTRGQLRLLEERYGLRLIREVPLRRYRDRSDAVAGVIHGRASTALLGFPGRCHRKSNGRALGDERSPVL